MFGLSHDAIIAKLDKTGDGKFTLDDIKAAAEKANADLQARQTTWRNALVLAAVSAVTGGWTALQLFCRH